ncbi:MAG: accessory gene regulator B family protein [Bacilli bacterium]|nr:accessory gene regulator B family protein [Bacilli bacterium]
MKKKILDMCINIISKNNNYSKDKLEAIRYGLEAIYLTVTKMFVIICIALTLGMVKEVFLLLITYNIIRSQAFGLHASKSIYCLISSLISFIGGAFICKYIIIPKIVMIVLAIGCNVGLLLYAPADTYKRPLINDKKRKRFKFISFVLGIIYSLIILFSNSKITNYLLIGMILAVIMILPITYKIFKLPYNNFKNYK